MARRRKQSGAGGFVYFLGPILGYFVPAVFVAIWIYFEARSAILARDLRDAGHAVETGMATALPAIYAQAEESDGRLAELYQEGDDQSLDRRADGRFDGRSKLGRQLNHEIVAAESDLQEAGDLSARIIGALSARSAARTAVLSWAGLTAFLTLIDGREFMPASALASLFAAVIGLSTYVLARIFMRN